MRAIKLPYPAPPSTHPWMSREQKLMRSAGMVVDFPERNVSYVIFVEGPKFDSERCAEEVRKSVELQSRGQEPQVLEIRFSQ